MYVPICMYIEYYYGSSSLCVHYVYVNVFEFVGVLSTGVFIVDLLCIKSLELHFFLM